MEVLVADVRRENMESARRHDENMMEERRLNAANIAKMSEEFRGDVEVLRNQNERLATERRLWMEDSIRQNEENEVLRNQPTRLASEREEDDGVLHFRKKRAKGDACKTTDPHKGNNPDEDTDPSGGKGGNQGSNLGAKMGGQGNPSGPQGNTGDGRSHRKETGGGRENKGPRTERGDVPPGVPTSPESTESEENNPNQVPDPPTPARPGQEGVVGY